MGKLNIRVQTYIFCKNTHYTIHYGKRKYNSFVLWLSPSTTFSHIQHIYITYTLNTSAFSWGSFNSTLDILVRAFMAFAPKYDFS